jgi:hypothetical protein
MEKTIQQQSINVTKHSKYKYTYYSIKLLQYNYTYYNTSTHITVLNYCNITTRITIQVHILQY